MTPAPSNELQEFHLFVGTRLSSGGVLLPEDVLNEWRQLHPLPDDGLDDIAAVEEALAAMENGDQGIPFEEFDREMRARFNLSPRS